MDTILVFYDIVSFLFLIENRETESDEAFLRLFWIAHSVDRMTGNG